MNLVWVLEPVKALSAHGGLGLFFPLNLINFPGPFSRTRTFTMSKMHGDMLGCPSTKQVS